MVNYSNKGLKATMGHAEIGINFSMPVLFFKSKWILGCSPSGSHYFEENMKILPHSCIWVVSAKIISPVFRAWYPQLGFIHLMPRQQQTAQIQILCKCSPSEGKYKQNSSKNIKRSSSKALFSYFLDSDLKKDKFTLILSLLYRYIGCCHEVQLTLWRAGG